MKTMYLTIQFYLFTLCPDLREGVYILGIICITSMVIRLIGGRLFLSTCLSVTVLICHSDDEYHYRRYKERCRKSDRNLSFSWKAILWDSFQPILSERLQILCSQPLPFSFLSDDGNPGPYFACLSSAQSLSHVQLFVTQWTVARWSPCPSPTPRAYSNSCPLSQWCHPTLSSSVIPFSSHCQSFPAPGSFQMNKFFVSGGQIIEASAWTSSPSNEYSGLISFRMDWLGLLAVEGTLKSLLQTTVQKFGAQLSL